MAPYPKDDVNRLRVKRKERREQLSIEDCAGPANKWLEKCTKQCKERLLVTVKNWTKINIRMESHELQQEHKKCEAKTVQTLQKSNIENDK